MTWKTQSGVHAKTTPFGGAYITEEMGGYNIRFMAKEVLFETLEDAKCYVMDEIKRLANECGDEVLREMVDRIAQALERNPKLSE